MLKAHMTAVENALLTTSKIPATSGHPLHKGTPREAFIKEFLENHLPSSVAIGTGEIIDANSSPNQSRNQHDIVIYKRSYPKLDFGGGISGFLVESVIATIEVKSRLTQTEFGRASKAAHNSKTLVPNTISSFRAGYVPPAVLNYVVAYDGPSSMKTVYGWVSPEYRKLGLGSLVLPLTPQDRQSTAAEALDAVLVLGKGFLYFDNIPYGFVSDQIRQTRPSANWVFADTPTGNILLLFSMIQMATANVEAKWLNPLPYLASFSVQYGLGP